MCVLPIVGPREGQVVKLTTGVAHIKSKTDCWLSFDEYRRLTQYVNITLIITLSYQCAGTSNQNTHTSTMEYQMIAYFGQDIYCTR